MNVNREIYNKNYTEESLRFKPTTTYDTWRIRLGLSLIEKYGTGKDVLDLCCGTGSYLIPMLGRVKSAVGVDFSSNMLNGFRKNLGGHLPPNLTLLEADVRSLPLVDRCFDFVFSYTSLYHVPNVELVIREIERVLRHGGYAAVELGNLHSLNTLVCNVQHEDNGWAKPFHISYRKMRQYLRDVGLDICQSRTSQVFPMYGAPRRLLYLYPLLSPVWKKIMGIQIGEKVLDEWISGSWPLRYLAFRHLFLVRKK